MFLDVEDIEDIEKIIIEDDLRNLTNNQIDEIIRKLDISVREDIDKRAFLYEKKLSLLLELDETKEMFLDRVFSGRGSLKWYILESNCENNDWKEQISFKIENEDKYRYKNVLEGSPVVDENPIIYGTVKLSEEKYIMRVIIPGSLRSLSDGVNLIKTRVMKNIVVIIDLQDEYIEIRSNDTDARNIKNNILARLFNLEDENNKITIKDKNILENYNDSLEEFRDDLSSGKFINVTSIPSYDAELDEEESNVLVSILKVLDVYFIDKDIEELVSKLEELDINLTNMTFTQLFLSGLSGIGLEMHEDIPSDLSNQSLYNAFKPYLEDRSGFINFNLSVENAEEDRKTILVGKGTNTIAFRSFATEEEIKYIRNKVI